MTYKQKVRFANTVKYYRQVERDMTINELSKATGVCGAVIWYIEHPKEVGGKRVRVSTIKKICYALGIDKETMDEFINYQLDD